MISKVILSFIKYISNDYHTNAVTLSCAFPLDLLTLPLIVTPPTLSTSSSPFRPDCLPQSHPHLWLVSVSAIETWLTIIASRFVDVIMHPRSLTIIILAYFDLPIPKDAPIELRPTPGKGWGLFATRDIQRGSLIMKERALFVIQKASENITEQVISNAVKKLGDPQKHILACLSGNKPRKLSNGLMSSGPLKLARIWGENCFSLETGVEQRLFGNYIEEKRWGLFPCHSRFNHSCQENAFVPESQSEPGVGRNSTSSFAVRDIAAGEEITIGYQNGFHSHTMDERRRLLTFECRCTVCDRASKDRNFRQVSDMRRRLMRGLVYLLDSIDENSEYDDDNSPHFKPVICDPVMRKAADNCDFP